MWAYADRIVIRQDGKIVAEHPRSFGRGQVVYDSWHYLPILTKKPGALRNGGPFKGWKLPNALGRLRTGLAGRDDGAYLEMTGAQRGFVVVVTSALSGAVSTT